MRKQRFSVMLWVVGVFVIGHCSPARAVGTEVDTALSAVTKLFRGIANAATGWMEIPKQISLTCEESGGGKGWTWGLAKGVGWAVARSVVGGYEIVTFPLPIPEGYKPILQPEYVMSDLDMGGKKSGRGGRSEE